MKIVYTMSFCPACKILKEQLKANNEPFEERVIGVDLSREEFMKQFPGITTVPYVIEE